MRKTHDHNCAAPLQIESHGGERGFVVPVAVGLVFEKKFAVRWWAARLEVPCPASLPTLCASGLVPLFVCDLSHSHAPGTAVSQRLLRAPAICAERVRARDGGAAGTSSALMKLYVPDVVDCTGTSDCSCSCPQSDGGASLRGRGPSAGAGEGSRARGGPQRTGT